MDNRAKIRPFYLLKLLYEMTDENHPLTTSEIVRLLEEKYDVKTQRTRIPEDIAALERFGFEIGRNRCQSVSYYFDRRLFELPELKLLIDAVESSSFITEKKSAELIQKLTSLASPYKASTLAKISEGGVMIRFAIAVAVSADVQILCVFLPLLQPAVHRFYGLLQRLLMMPFSRYS